MAFHIVTKKTLIILSIFFLLIFLALMYRIFHPYQPCKNCNLIIISVDALRADHMGLYGYPLSTTPNIDRWAKNAFVFNNVRTTVPATYPSFVSLMTGKTPFESAINNNWFMNETINPQGGSMLPKDIITLAQQLKQKGYTTGAFVTNFQLMKDYTNMDRGFDTYEYLDKLSVHHNVYEDFLYKAFPWMNKNKNNKFFLWIHLMDPHAPYSQTPEVKCKFVDKKICDTVLNQNYEELEKIRRGFEGCHAPGPTDNQIKAYRGLYDSAIFESDKIVNNILNQIHNTGLDKKSIIVFYGDHGESFEHNFYFGHGHTMYDSTLKIPFIVKYPNLNNTRFIKNLYGSNNIKHMLINLLDTQFLNRFVIDSIFNNNKSDHVTSVNTSFTKASITDTKYKYIYNYNGSCIKSGEREELYDLTHDPKETKNIIKSNAEIANNLKTLLLREIDNKENIIQDINNIKSQKEIDTINKLKSLGY